MSAHYKLYDTMRSPTIPEVGKDKEIKNGDAIKMKVSPIMKNTISSFSVRMERIKMTNPTYSINPFEQTRVLGRREGRRRTEEKRWRGGGQREGFNFLNNIIPLLVRLPLLLRFEFFGNVSMPQHTKHSFFFFLLFPRFPYLKWEFSIF